METITIGTKEAPAEIAQRLSTACAPLLERGTPLQFSVEERGELSFVRCRLGEGAGRNDGADLRRAVVAVLSRWIVERSAPARLRQLVGRQCDEFSAQERDRILELARQELNSSLREGGSAEEQWRQMALERLTEYLERADTVVIEGFVTFRLREHVEELSRLVEQVAEGVLLEREYREFVDLLLHVVEGHPDRTAEVHCSFDPEGGVHLEDGDGRAVGTAFLAPPEDDGHGPEAGLEELVVSALITLAPRRLHLHLGGAAGEFLSADTLALLRAVFRGGISVCRDCPRCRALGAGPAAAASKHPSE